jgi:hypothetical protein
MDRLLTLVNEEGNEIGLRISADNNKVIINIGEEEIYLTPKEVNYLNTELDNFSDEVNERLKATE